MGIKSAAMPFMPERMRKYSEYAETWIIVAMVAWILTESWLPLGPGKGMASNYLFVAVVVGGLMLFFDIFRRGYPRMLAWCPEPQGAFFVPALVHHSPGAFHLAGIRQSDRISAWIHKIIRALCRVESTPFPGLGKEFMPDLDEGAFLFMPTTMPHASIGEAMDVLRKQDMMIQSIPEVDSAVGKLGRAETPLDPAPVSMIETVINYKPEYLVDKSGKRLRFKFHQDQKDYFRDVEGELVPANDGYPYLVQGYYERDDSGGLIPDPGGKPFRIWRPALNPGLNPDRAPWKGITSPDDIWDEIVKAAKVPGVTSAPKLQPIAARIVMLQSGMRAPMGIKVKGPNLATLEKNSS